MLREGVAMPARKTHTKHMDEETRLAKNKRIKEAGIATRARRSKMTVKVFDLKIAINRLNQTQKEALTRVFLECKWIRNHALASQRFDLDFLKELNGQVPVKTPSGVENRRIVWLGSQMQQSVIHELSRNLEALNHTKANGRKVGKLKFVTECKSIDLKQFGSTHKLLIDGKGRLSKAKVQNIPGKLPIRGFEQLKRNGIEFANAKLVSKPDGWHILLTTYLPPEEKPKPKNEIGVDFGVKDQFTLSSGSTFLETAGETERLKRLQRKLSRQVKNSNSYLRTRAKLQREYQRIDYRKNELANQLVHKWTEYNFVYFQDESIKSWMRRDSKSRGTKKIHAGILGRVKARLRNSDRALMLPRYVATTAWCPKCGNKTPHDLSRRLFECGCGYTANRDVHAARNMVILGKRYKQLITSGTEGSAGGESVRLDAAFYAPVKQFSMKPETAKSLVSP